MKKFLNKLEKMEYPDFTKPTIMYDVVLIVENRRLYANRALLSIWSPVFETMFKGNFKEKDALDMTLPGNLIKIYFYFRFY